MLPYFIVAGCIAFMALISPAHRVHYFTWGAAFLTLLVFVGLRHKVGMDWNNYLIITERIGTDTLANALSDRTEPGFALLTWASTQLNMGVYGVNFVGSGVFLFGLFKYAKRTPYPWIALLTALPMLIVVVSMSASRQIIAIGIILLLVANFEDLSIFKRTIYVLIASTFHQSAILFLSLIIVRLKIRLWIKIALSLVFFAAALVVLDLSGYAEYYDDLYITGQTAATTSEGALLHVLYNAGPATAALLLKPIRIEMWRISPITVIMALGAIALVPLSLVFSTASSRVSMYFYPVAMLAFSLVPSIIATSNDKAITKYLIALFFPAVLWLWLTLSNSGHAYIPYGNVLTAPDHLLRFCCK